MEIGNIVIPLEPVEYHSWACSRPMNIPHWTHSRLSVEQSLPGECPMDAKDWMMEYLLALSKVEENTFKRRTKR